VSTLSSTIALFPFDLGAAAEVRSTVVRPRNAQYILSTASEYVTCPVRPLRCAPRPINRSLFVYTSLPFSSPDHASLSNALLDRIFPDRAASISYQYLVSEGPLAQPCLHASEARKAGLEGAVGHAWDLEGSIVDEGRDEKGRYLVV